MKKFFIDPHLLCDDEICRNIIRLFLISDHRKDNNCNIDLDFEVLHYALTCLVNDSANQDQAYLNYIWCLNEYVKNNMPKESLDFLRTQFIYRDVSLSDNTKTDIKKILDNNNVNYDFSYEGFFIYYLNVMINEIAIAFSFLSAWLDNKQIYELDIEEYGKLKFPKECDPNDIFDVLVRDVNNGVYSSNDNPICVF